MSAVPTANLGNAGQVHQPAATQPLNRSCESCRSLKVRCLPDPTTPNQCQRCAKAKRSCIFMAPQRRRPRKRTDSRVAHLEREMRAMRSLLKDRFRVDEESPESASSEKEGSHENEPVTESTEMAPTIPEAPSSPAGSTRQMDFSPGFGTSGTNTLDSGSLSVPSCGTKPAGFSPDLRQGDDVIDRGVISLESAEDLVAFFMNELTPFFPFVVLPPGSTASQMRRLKPVLFLSVIAAAAIAIDSSLARTLNREMVRLYADRFFIEGDKSLELVQALLLMIVFYFPVDSPLKLQYYQYTHIAATMALEIGLASKRRVSKKKDDDGGFDEHMAEQARAILGCYHLASTIAMKTRRPNMLIFNDWMSECVKHLERSPNTIDRHLATWFKLQRIIDEAMASFGLDDTSSTTPLTEARIRAVLRWFDNRMQSWEKNTPPDMLTVPMTLEYHYTFLAVYELAVGEGYRDPDAIKRKYYTLPPLDEDGNVQQPGAPLSAVRVDITMKWLHAAHEILDTFLNCDTETMRKIPNLTYTRVVTGVMSMLKIYFSVRSGALGEVIGPQTLNLDMYLEAMTRKLTEAGGGQKYKIPSRWWYVVAVKARDWYDRFQKRQAQKEAGLIPPVKASPSTPQHPIAVRNHLQFDPVDPSRMGSSFDMTGVPQFSTFENMSTYGAPPAMTPMWPSDTNLVNLNQFTGYTPPSMPPQLAHDAQQFSTDTNQSESFFPPGTGMELDGWIPDGSIFGMPALPGF